MKQRKLILYHRWIGPIGGVETFIYNFCVTMRKYYDIKVLYDEIAPAQIYRIYPYAVVEHREDNKIYECDVVVNNTASWVKFPNNIKADVYYTIIHCDYKDYIRLGHVNPVLNEGHQYICVKPYARNSFSDLLKVPCDVIEGTLQPDVKTKKVLHLVSATRLTIEKGKERMYKLIHILRDSGIKFDWKIFTKDKFDVPDNCPEVILMQPTFDIYDYMADADYLVQLSDTEALCLAVRESLSVGTPVIVTDIPGFDYIEDGVLGYKVNLDMSNVDIDKIYNHIPKVKWKENKDEILEKWFEKLGKPVEIDKPLNEMKKVKIKILIDYTDIVLKKYITAGTIMEVDEPRAITLCQATIERPKIAERIRE